MITNSLGVLTQALGDNVFNSKFGDAQHLPPPDLGFVITIDNDFVETIDGENVSFIL